MGGLSSGVQHALSGALELDIEKRFSATEFKDALQGTLFNKVQSNIKKHPEARKKSFVRDKVREMVDDEVVMISIVFFVASFVLGSIPYMVIGGALGFFEGLFPVALATFNVARVLFRFFRVTKGKAEKEETITAGLYQVWVTGEEGEIVVDRKSAIADSNRAAEIKVIHLLDVDIDTVEVCSKRIFVKNSLGEWKKEREEA